MFGLLPLLRAFRRGHLFFVVETCGNLGTLSNGKLIWA